MAAVALVAAPAAKRGVDIVIDQLVDGAKYIARIWSAYGANVGEAQEVADYANHVMYLLEKLKQSAQVSRLLISMCASLLHHKCWSDLEPLSP
jgi:hypothetical protein